MASRQASMVLEQVQRVLAAREGERLSDRELLERFVYARDEHAFGVLVKRHGAMVFNVCRRILHNEHDAEDAFQAAFLVLARKASACSWQESVGPWLYRVAHRLALKLKADTVRHKRSAQVSETSPSADPLALACGRELCAALDEELSRLPEKLRAPLVLCCLESWTRDEVAQQLGLALSVVKHRLEDGRTLLRQRLLRRGFPLSAVLAAGLWSEHVAHAAAPFRVVQSLVRSAGLVAAGKTPQILVSTRVIALMEEASKGMSYMGLKAVVVIVLSTCLVCTASALALRSGRDGTSSEAVVNRQESPAEKAGLQEPEAESRLNRDQYGDPLPKEALARLGTVRFRCANAIHSLTYTPDGKSILSGGADGVHLWDAATGKEIRWLGGELAARYGPAALSPDGKKVAVAGGGGRQEDGLAVYELSTGRLLYRYGKFCDQVIPAGFSADSKILAVNYSSNTSVELVNADTGALLRSMREYLPSLEHLGCHQIAFSPDGKTLIYPNKGGVLQVVDAATGKELRRLTTVPGGIASMALSPDGRRLAFTALVTIDQGGGQTTMFGESRVHVWDLASGTEIRELVVPPGQSEGGFPLGPHVKFSPDGKLLLTAGNNCGLRVWSIATGAQVSEFRENASFVTAVAFTPDGKTVALADAAQCIRLWDLATGRDLLTFEGHRDEVDSLTLSVDGRQAATADQDGSIHLWDRMSGVKLGNLTGHNKPIRQLVYAANGEVLFSTGADKRLRFWNLSNRRELRPPHECKYHWSLLNLSPDGATLACLDAENEICLFSAGTGTQLRRLTGPAKSIEAIHFSADSQTLMAWSRDQQLHFWKIATGKHHQHACAAEPYSVAFSPDGRYVAFGGFDFLVIKSVATGQEVRRFAGIRPKTNSGIGRLVFSPDGRSLAWGDAQDAVIEFGEAASGRVRHRFVGHRGGIRCLAFSNDGKVLVSGASDTTALVWDLSGRSSSNRNLMLGLPALDSLWTALAGDDATRAYDAIRILAGAPDYAIPYLQKRLSPVPLVDKIRIAKLIADLDSTKFAVRQSATRELEGLGEIAESAYRKTLAGRPSLEVRQRLDELLNKLRNLPSEQLRTVRAMETLELADTPKARKFLAALAQGEPEAQLTKDAKGTLQRGEHAAAAKSAARASKP